jgi:hypothetical protein
MHGRAWIASGLLMALMAFTVVLLLMMGARRLLNARQAQVHSPRPKVVRFRRC